MCSCLGSIFLGQTVVAYSYMIWYILVKPVPQRYILVELKRNLATNKIDKTKIEWNKAIGNKK